MFYDNTPIHELFKRAIALFLEKSKRLFQYTWGTILVPQTPITPVYLLSLHIPDLSFI